MHMSRPASINELAVLMELRLAFGPGTRLWANSSREDLCYEWLYFKGRQATGSLRDFAKSLIAREDHGLADPRPVCEIRKRVAAVLKAHRIKRPLRSTAAPPTSPAARPGKAGPAGVYPMNKAMPGNVDTLGAAR
jgi:hypothetical protein